MPAAGSNGASYGGEPDFDAVVIGAGFSGLGMLHQARERGLRLRIIEAAPEVGGTWYFNRYPGARTDTESWVYSFSFDLGLQRAWTWPERFPTQRDVQRYLEYVADRFDMRRDIEFNTRVTAAHFEESTHTWAVSTDTGKLYRCRFLVSAAGQLAKVNEPPFPGLNSFRGEYYLTARWPKQEPNLWGKRVAVIGTGATGVQIIPMVAEMADSVTVFQRTPNWVLPARNYSMTEARIRNIKANYEEISKIAGRTASGLTGIPRTTRLYSDVTPAEAQKVFERAWEIGGLNFMGTTFSDLMVNAEANTAAGDFVRRKIRSIVEDPAKADILCPGPENLFGARRVPLGHHYYETYNRPNVSLVDISENGIVDATPRGILLTDGREYEFDVIIFALGFDAFTGAHAAIGICGPRGLSLAARWADGPATFFSMAVDGFPNLFLLSGPHVPLAPALQTIEPTAEWVADLMKFCQKNNYTRVEVTPDAVQRHAHLIESNLQRTVMRHGVKLRAWFLGANIPGKPIAPLLNYGKFAEFREAIEVERKTDYPSFLFSSLSRCNAEHRQVVRS